MYCPNCKTHYDKGKFCEECGTKLVEDPQTQGVGGLNIGDGNTIDGGVHLTHDDHSTKNTTITNVTHERMRTEGEIVQEKKVRYLNECRRAYADNVLEQHELAELETLRVELGLDKSTADAILDSVRNMVTKSATKNFSEIPPIAKIKIDKFTKSVRENDVASIMKQIDGIESLSNKFPQVDLQYKYYLVLAALKPEKCVERFENRRFDNYWCSFWTYIAYLKIGKQAKAEDILFDIPTKYTGYPDDNVNLLATAGAVIKGEKDDAWDFLNAVTGDFTPLLQRFADTLYFIVDPVTATEMGVTEDSCAFYLQNMFGAESEDALLEEAIGLIAKQVDCFSKGEPSDDIQVQLAALCEKVTKADVKQKILLEWNEKVVPLFYKFFADDAAESITVESVDTIGLNLVDKEDFLDVLLMEFDSIAEDDDFNDDVLGFVKFLMDDAKYKEDFFNQLKEYCKPIFSKKIDECISERERIIAEEKKNNAEEERKSKDAEGKKMQDNLESAISLFEKEEYEDAYSLLQGLEKQGCTDSRFQFYIGKCYAGGHGVQKDEEKAVEWFTKAADQGEAEAQLSIGTRYYSGNGVKEDKQKAVEWFTKSADQGNAAAQLALGICYYYGFGVKKDKNKAVTLYTKAVEWFTKAAELGDARAQFTIGNCFEHGYGVKENKKKAMEWFSKAAEQGYAKAKEKLQKIEKDSKYNYHPKTKEELKKLIEKLIKERGNNADLNDIDTSKITDMSYLFEDAYEFNGDISKWDVSNVTNMESMFQESDFNGDISNWDVSNVTDMNGMFYIADKFNGDLSKWNVSKVTDMASMFCEAESFNGDISNWDVSNVEDMSDMFSGAISFNGNISKWDVTNVEDMEDMFNGAKSFDGDISHWNVGKVTNMRSMFKSSKLSGKEPKWYKK